MTKKISLIILCFFAWGCASKDKAASSLEYQKISKKYPAVTIETSGDFYFEEDGSNVQMDLFGSCAHAQTVIFIEVDGKKTAAPCHKGRYRYALNLKRNFFGQRVRGPGGKSFVLKKIRAFHKGHKKLNATSYLLIDKEKREVKSVINKQVRYERIPTGQYEPITQFNAFGSCSEGSSVTIDVTSLDRFGHRVSKFDETKACQASGFYFLSQIDGIIKKGTKFHLYETKTHVPAGRLRAPASKSKPKLKNLFEWTVEVSK